MHMQGFGKTVKHRGVPSFKKSVYKLADKNTIYL
jgi:hypothetical protein